MSGRPKKRTGFQGTPNKKSKPNTLNATNMLLDDIQSIQSMPEIDLNVETVTNQIVSVDKDTKPFSKEISIGGNIPDENIPTPFLPINEGWQNEMCNLFGIELHSAHHIISAEKAGKPSLTKQIKGDGNCFYRAISFLVSGTEENHIIVRTYLLQHMLQYSAIAAEQFGIDNMGSYVDQQGLGEWAGENEIFFMAHLLKTDICIYSTGYLTGWQVHSGKHIDSNLQTSWQMLYLSHPNENHYEVVLSTDRSLTDDSCASTSSRQLIKAIVNDQSSDSKPSYSQVLMKSLVVDELFRQNDLINKANTKKNDETDNAPIMKSPIKRKVKYVSIKSTKRMQSMRAHLDDESKENAKTSAKKGMQSMRENLDDESKENAKTSAKK